MSSTQIKIICYNENCPLHQDRPCLNHKSVVPRKLLDSKSKNVKRVIIQPEIINRIRQCWVYIYE